MSYTRESFIGKCNIYHHNLYDYSLVEYKNIKSSVKIICHEHGVFDMIAYSHMTRSGCPKCNGGYKFTLKDFIEKSIKTHGDKYDYSLSEYINSKSKILIICN